MPHINKAIVPASKGTTQVTVDALTATIRQAVQDGHIYFRKYITHNSRMLKGKSQVGLDALADEFRSIGYEVQA